MSFQAIYELRSSSCTAAHTEHPRVFPDGAFSTRVLSGPSLITAPSTQKAKFQFNGDKLDVRVITLYPCVMSPDFIHVVH